MKSCYIELNIYAGISFLFIIILMLAKQEKLTPPGHLISPLVCRGPWMSTVVLYCWCPSDSASVLLYFTFMFSLKKINTGNFKKKTSVPKSPHISFSALRVGKKPLWFFFSIKRLGKYSSRRTRDFLLLFLFCFSMKVGKKRTEQGDKNNHPSWSPPPPTPCLPLCCIHYLK